MPGEAAIRGTDCDGKWWNSGTFALNAWFIHDLFGQFLIVIISQMINIRA